jgi:hypothetical protein
MKSKSKINVDDLVKLITICNKLENYSLECETDFAKKRIKELKFDLELHRYELKMLTGVSTGQCQTDQFIYDEFVKMLPEALAWQLCLFDSTAIRPVASSTSRL